MAKIVIWAQTSYLEEYEIEADSFDEAVKILQTNSLKPTKREMSTQFFGPFPANDTQYFCTKKGGKYFLAKSMTIHCSKG